SDRASAMGTVGHEWRILVHRMRLFPQEFGWNRSLRRFALPHNRHHPPTLSVEDQLKAVDPALKRLRVVGIVARFVGAEDLSDVCVTLDLVRHSALEESFFFQKRTRALNVFLWSEHPSAHIGLAGTLPGRNQPRSGIEERTETIPVAL